MFCDEFEALVTRESIRDWWHNGITEKSLTTYNQSNFPELLGEIQTANWLSVIDGMLARVPYITRSNHLQSYWFSLKKLVKLSSYEKTKDNATLSELAL